jgi:uncharacterized protein
VNRQHEPAAQPHVSRPPADRDATPPDRRYPTPASLGPLVRAVAPGHHRGGEGSHGLAHWARVLENGLRLAPATGANVTVVALFAVFHDARRANDHRDPGHGERGAVLARELRDEWLDLTDAEMEVLFQACAHHTDGTTEADVTVQTCWDADRLDLPRAGITVRAERLCTPAARERAIIDWAEERSLARFEPGFVAGWREPERRPPGA